MSAEPKATPCLHTLFQRFAMTLPVIDVPDSIEALRAIPAYKGVLIQGKVLGLAVARDISRLPYVSDFVLILTLDNVLAGACTCSLIPSVKVFLHTQELDEATARAYLFAIVDSTPVLESENNVGDIFELRKWLLQALDRSLNKEVEHG